jgi:hypothetical protein
MARLNNTLLAKYKDSDLMRLRKAQFILIFDFIYMFLLAMMSLIMLSSGLDRFLKMVS